MEKESIISKIKKLFALANGSAATPAESASAMGKAHALMLQHKIAQASLEAPTESNEKVKQDDQPLNMEDEGKRKLSRFKVTLASTLATHNGCKAASCGPTILLFGKDSDIATVRYLYQHCIREIDRLTKRYSPKGRSNSNNFRYGCVDAIREAMEQEQRAIREAAQASVDERSLVVVDKSLAAIHRDAMRANAFMHNQYKVSKASRSLGQYKPDARAAGREAGRSIYNGKRAGAIE